MAQGWGFMGQLFQLLRHLPLPGEKSSDIHVALRISTPENHIHHFLYILSSDEHHVNAG